MKVSFRTYYPNGNKCDHIQDLTPGNLIYWLACYFFTHPDCESITIKIWRDDFPVEIKVDNH